MYTLVIKKSTQRAVFIRPSTVPLMVDALWSPVDHSYILWDGETNQNIIDYVLVTTPEPTLAFTPLLDEERVSAREAQQKGDLLQLLRRGLVRARSTISKSLELQDEVYAHKLREAQSFPASTDVPFLTQDAAFHGITVPEAARLVLLKAAQQKSILLETELQRRTYIKRILEAAPSDYIQIRKELAAYEREH